MFKSSLLIFAALALVILFSPKAHCQQKDPQTESLRLQRLQTAAEIWSRLFLAHPATFTNHLDFEQVLIEAIPSIERAGTAEEFVEVLNEKLFYPLNDPLAFAQVIEPGKDKGLDGPTSLHIRKVSGHVLMLDATDQRAYEQRDIINKINGLLRDVKQQDTLFVDMRWKTARPVYYHPAIWLRLFANSSLPTGFHVSRQMIQRTDFLLNPESSVYGFSNQSLKVEISKNLEPLRTSKNEYGWAEEFDPISFDSLVIINNPVYFIVNNSSYPSIQHTLDALQGQENIRVLWEKSGNFLVSGFLSTYPENIRANLGCDLLISRTGFAGVLPDRIYPVAVGELRLVEDVRKGIPARERNANAKPFSFTTGNAPGGSSGVFAGSFTREERMASLIKIWMVLNFMFPHLEHATIDWENVLRDWIPKAEKAQTPEDYVLTLQMLLARLNDSHFGVWYRKPPHAVGNFLSPVRLKLAEGRVIVAETAENFSGNDLKIGDPVESINGVAIDSINRFWRQRYSASSDQAFNRWLWNSPLAIATRGEKDSTVKLKILSKGKAKEITLSRTMRTPWISKEEHILSKRMPGNIGYIRHYMTPTEAMRDSILDSFADTEGLIIDLRGRPRFSIFSLATWFSKEPIPLEKFEAPLTFFNNGLLFTGTALYPPSFFQPHPDRHYGKPVVVLIDANMQSHSESAAMILRNIAHVTLVGSPTTGTTGSAIPLSLRVGMNISYTSQKVSNTDGRAFQNIGVVPDVLAEPTIQGIKEGRDEVLEKGMAVIKQRIEERNKSK